MASRVTCPACGTDYAIPAGLMPPGGRRVQCSACTHVWHQPAPPADETEAALLARLTARQARPPAEFRWEGPIRAAEAADTAPDAALPDSGASAGKEAGTAAASPDADPAQALGAGARGRDAASQPDAAPPTEPAAEAAPLPRRPRRLGLGFAAGILLVAIGIGAYVEAAGLGAAVPVLHGPIGAYAAAIDDARHWLEAQYLAYEHRIVPGPMQAQD